MKSRQTTRKYALPSPPVPLSSILLHFTGPVLAGKYYWLVTCNASKVPAGKHFLAYKSCDVFFYTSRDQYLSASSGCIQVLVAWNASKATGHKYFLANKYSCHVLFYTSQDKRLPRSTGYMKSHGALLVTQTCPVVSVRPTVAFLGFPKGEEKKPVCRSKVLWNKVWTRPPVHGLSIALCSKWFFYLEVRRRFFLCEWIKICKMTGIFMPAFRSFLYTVFEIL